LAAVTALDGLPNLVENQPMGVTGLEQPAKSSANAAEMVQGGAESGALGVENTPVDAQLASVVEVWPKLSEPIKAGILAMIQAAGAG
jgi:hypothetical protein